MLRQFCNPGLLRTGDAQLSPKSADAGRTSTGGGGGGGGGGDARSPPWDYLAAAAFFSASKRKYSSIESVSRMRSQPFSVM